MTFEEYREFYLNNIINTSLSENIHQIDAFINDVTDMLINDFNLIPDYAVLDPKPTLSLPPFITACTGMDALSHAIEAYIGNSTTKKTRAYALKVTKLIFENIYKVYEGGNDLEARSNMFDAAFYAGHAFTVSYVDMCRRLLIHWVKNIILRMD